MEQQTFVTVPLEQWNKMLSLLERVEERLKPKDEWVNTKQACKILGVTPNTLKSYRDKFHIQCHQVGRNILMLRSSLYNVIKERSL